MTLLDVSHLTVELAGHKIIADLSFQVLPGDTLAIIGPNGAGKTVLFKALLGLLPYSGQISWPKEIRIGYVPQRLYV